MLRVGKREFIRRGRALLLGVFYAAVAAGSAAAAGDDTRLHYSVYLGGLPLGHVDVDLRQDDGSYVIRSMANTNRSFEWLITWVASGETAGRIILGKFVPDQHRHTSRWRNNERIVRIDYATDGSVRVEKTGAGSPSAGELTPIDPVSLTHSIDPMSAILMVTHRLEQGRGCNVRLPIFDGHRRYDAIVSDVEARSFKPTTYSVFSGTAIGCRVEFVRLGGFPVNPGAGQDNNGSAIIWFGAPASDGRLTPVRLQQTTQFGALEVHLDRYDAGDIRVVTPNAR